MPNLDVINQRLIHTSQQTGIPLVATNDAHYIHRAQHPVHDLYLAIQTDSTLEQPNRLRMEDDSYYLKSAAEMHALFDDLPEALRNSVAIGQQCHVDIDFGRKRLPTFPTPEGQDADAYLAELCQDGFQRLCPADDPTYRKRLEYELEVIRQTQFADYFLIVWDIIRFARRNGIQYGVRGSAAASLALYCLDITIADPIRHRLVFERFLNLERKEMPDIDMDFQDDRRDEVMNYTVDRYRSSNVGQIVTFNRFGVKSTIRAAARAMAMPYQTADRIARAAPAKSATIAHALENSANLRALATDDPQIDTLLQHAQGLEGIVHHTGSHAAAIVIASEPLTEITPLQPPTGATKDTAADPQTPTLNLTQYSMEPIAKLGLLKMDFLGLTSLAILDQSLKTTPGGPRQLADIPLDDAETYRLLGSGNTANVFQLESDGMQRYIRDLKPSNIGDIAAMIALYRPGPMENIDRFIRSKHGLETITFPHPSMQELLDETYGVIVYQDQVLHIMQNFAGYTMGEADIVRKAMGKKIPELMRKERQRFVTMAQNQGHTETIASDIFNTIEPFAGYAFNKAHSVSYALISYWTAWYKTHHPAAYMSACLNCRQTQNKETYRATIAECRRMGLTLDIPCINQSMTRSQPQEHNRIRLGLSAIQGLGEHAAAPIITARDDHGPYQNLADFCRRSPKLPTKQLEMLIKAGALDSIAERRHALQNLPNIQAEINDQANARDSGQIGLFGADSHIAPIPEWLTQTHYATPASPEQMGQMETEALGIAISRNPAEILKAIAGPGAITSVSRLQQTLGDEERKQTTVAGFVADIQKRQTKDGKPFVTATLALADREIETMVWSDVLDTTADCWQLHNALRITGNCHARDEGFTLTAQTVQILDPDRPPPYATQPLIITIQETDNTAGDTAQLHKALRLVFDHPGADNVQLHIRPMGKRPLIKTEMTTMTVDANDPDLLDRLNRLEGVTA